MCASIMAPVLIMCYELAKIEIHATESVSLAIHN